MNQYIQSFRPRTLPLSVAGILTGSGMALKQLTEQCGTFTIRQWLVFVFAILTTLSLQILANLANEIGDMQHGTDSEQHARQQYGLQSGKISLQQMFRLMWLFVGLSAVFGVALVWTSFQTFWLTDSLFMLALGVCAIAGAMTYTMGKHAYGYHALGDAGVFIFFGLVSVMGSYFLLMHTLTWHIAAMAALLALPIVGVINLNNIRDMENDKKHGKHTLAVALGKKGARIYHACLLFFSIIGFTLLQHYYVLIILPIWIWHIYQVTISEGKQLDKQMPVLSFSTLALSILCVI